MDSMSSERPSRGRRNGGIPIPSFSSLPTIQLSQEEDDAQPCTTTTTITSSSSSESFSIPLTLHFSKDDLITVETALQLQFYRKRQQQKQQQQASSNVCFSLDECLGLLSKIALPSGGERLKQQQQDAEHPSLQLSDNCNDGDNKSTDNLPSDMQQMLRDFSDSERLLYDFLLFASPTLYTLSKSDTTMEEDQQQENSVSLQSSNNSKGTPDSRTVWYIYSVATLANGSTSNNRMQQLRKLLHEKITILHSECKALIRAITDHRKYSSRGSSILILSQQQGTATTSAGKEHQQPPSPPSLVTKKRTAAVMIMPGMSLEQRVQARASANEEARRASEVEQSALRQKHVGGGWKNNISRGEENDNSSKLARDAVVDCLFLSRVADALWLHSRNVLGRQSRFSVASAGSQLSSSLTSSIFSATTKQTAAPQHAPPPVCTLTLQDAVSLLSRTPSVTAHLSTMNLTSSKNGSGNENIDDDTRPRHPSTKRQIVQAIQELCRLAPSWISVTDSTNNNTKDIATGGSSGLSKFATIWIRSEKYQAAQDILSGKKRKPVDCEKNQNEQQQQQSISTASNGSNNNTLKRPLSHVIPDNDGTANATMKKTKPQLKVENASITNGKSGTGALMQQLNQYGEPMEVVATADPEGSVQLRNNTSPVRSKSWSNTITTSAKGRIQSLPMATAVPLNANSTMAHLPMASAVPVSGAAENGASITTTPTRAVTMTPPPISAASWPSSANAAEALRMNRSLIFTDADHSGGELIRPSLLYQTSPRGLRSLFRSLNNGHRI